MDVIDKAALEWPEETRRQHIVVRTLVAVAMACFAVMLHEYAHAVAQIIAGADASTIGAMSAEPSGRLSRTAEGWTAAAGPLFSLTAGLVVWLVARRLEGVGFHLAFWFYVAGIQNAAGYLIITPFGVGDTAVVVERWGWPLWGQFVMTALGVAMMFGLAALVSADVQARLRTVRSLRTVIMWPVLWATIALVTLSLVLGLIADYEMPVLFAMVMSMVSVYVAALMSSLFWGRFPFRSADMDPGPLWFAATLAAVGITIWVVHGVVGVTIG